MYSHARRFLWYPKSRIAGSHWVGFFFFFFLSPSFEECFPADFFFFLKLLLVNEKIPGLVGFSEPG